MIIKIAGIILIMLSASAMGMFYSYQEDYRIEDLLNMKKAFLILRSEIEYSLTSIPESAEYISSRIDGNIKDIFREFGEMLNTKGREGAETLWKKALQVNKSRCFLKNEDVQTLYSFGKTAGSADKKLQLNTIDMITAYIDEKTAELTEISAKNKKLYKSLGVLGGMAVCIILI